MKWVGIAIIGLIIVIGIAIITPMIMNEGPNAIHTVGYGFVPFHFGFIGIFFFIIIVIFISRWLFKTNRCGYSTRYYRGYSKRENALKIISERYAK